MLVLCNVLFRVRKKRKKKTCQHYTACVYASSLNTGVLEIPAALPSHAGRYTCSARNPAGVAHKHVTVTVQGRAARDQLARLLPTHCENSRGSLRVSPPPPVPCWQFQSLQKLGQWLRRYKWCCITGLFCRAKFKVFPGRPLLGKERAFRSPQVMTQSDLVSAAAAHHDACFLNWKHQSRKPLRPPAESG